MFHLSVSLLRHYEKEGLLLPEVIDPETGYRYYSTRQFEVLGTICYLRVLDTPLREIADYLNNRDVDKLMLLLRKQKNTVEDKLRELEIIHAKIENRMAQLQHAIEDEKDTIRFEYCEPCRIAWLERPITIRSYLDLEPFLRVLEENEKQTSIFLGKVGIGISEQRLKIGEYNGYDSVFLLLDAVDSYEGETQSLPSSVCVTVTFRGTHLQAEPYYEKILQTLREENWESRALPVRSP